VGRAGQGVKLPDWGESVLDGQAAKQALQWLVDEEGDGRA